MKKAFLAGFILLVSGVVVLASAQSTINPNELSLKAGPTAPGEQLSMVWLEAFLYPKNVKQDKTVLLGVKLPSSVKTVTAQFDFQAEAIALHSDDSKNWSAQVSLPETVSSGVHVARYVITSDKGSIQRTVDFFVLKNENASASNQSSPNTMDNVPLTIASTSTVFVDGISRTLPAGQIVTAVAKVPWFKIVLEDGKDGWIASTAVHDPSQELCQQGFKAYEAGNFDQALKLYNQSVAADPNNAKAWLWLAKSYNKLNDLTNSQRAAREALRLDNRDMDIKLFAQKLAADIYNSSHDKFVEGRYNEAIEGYQQVIALKPVSYVSWIEMGQSYEKLGFIDEARNSWREALKINPEDPQVYALLKIKYDSQAIANLSSKPEAIAAKSAKDLPSSVADDSLTIVKAEKTSKGTRIDTAIKSVITLTKSLGTPVVEKGWTVKKRGSNFLVSYLVEQGAGILETFDWLVDIDTRKVSANNDNAKVLMTRW